MATSSHYQNKKIYKGNRGYLYVWLNNRNTPIHVHVWEEKNGQKPKGYQLHHKDENKENYSLENLELVTPLDHTRIHKKWTKDSSGKWVAKLCSKCNKSLLLKYFYSVKTRNTYSAFCRGCTKQKSKNDRQQPTWQERHNQYLREWRRRKSL